MNNFEINKETLYNGDVKNHYLTSIDNEGSRKTSYFNLKAASKMEREFRKDLFEMTQAELDLVYHAARKTTETAVASYISHINSYIRWASINGYRGTNLPKQASESIASIAHKYVSKTKSTYYTQDDLMYYYDLLPNLSDVMIIQCVFEGIRGQESSEIFNIKAADLSEKNDRYYINLYDTIKGEERFEFEISKFLFETIYKTSETDIYKTPTGKEFELVPSKYVLRKTAKGKKASGEGEKLAASYLTNKNILYRDIFENGNFRLKDIEKSGVMYYLYTLLNKKESHIVTQEEYKAIANKYNIGKYIHNYTNEETVNYNVIRSTIDIDFYKEHYGNIELT